MNEATLGFDEIRRRLSNDGLKIRSGPFSFCIQSSLPDIADGVALLYGNYPLADGEDFIDFHISVDQPENLRRWYRKQVVFRFDGLAPFAPLPLNQSLPVLEWGLNWTIAGHSNEYLILHAAALERNGRTLIMPGPPGSGKSTLCTALVHHGWRLLSDELALISLVDGSLHPLVRPISLKNESIDIIRRRYPDCVLSNECHDTNKGTVALLKAPSESVTRMNETSRPGWIIFPKYQAGVPLTATPHSKSDTLLYVGENAFNYSILGATGFKLLADLVSESECYDFAYSSLDDAIPFFDELAAGANSVR